MHTSESRLDPGKKPDGSLRRRQSYLSGRNHETCSWDEGHYQNFGPARLPSIHTTILGYCRKFGVAMEVEVNIEPLRHPARTTQPTAAMQWCSARW